MAVKPGAEEKPRTDGKNPGQTTDRAAPLRKGWTQAVGQCQDHCDKGKTYLIACHAIPCLPVASAIVLAQIFCAAVFVQALINLCVSAIVQISEW